MREYVLLLPILFIFHDMEEIIGMIVNLKFAHMLMNWYVKRDCTMGSSQSIMPSVTPR